MSVIWRRTGGVGRGAVLALAALAVGSLPASGQGRDSIPGVTLGLVYEAYSPALAMKPFTGRFGGGGVAPQVEAIVGRDLHNSDRFEVMDSLPASLLGDGVDYKLWDDLGAVWLVTGQVEGAGEGYVLLLELHDVVYGEVKERGRFRIPDPASDGFRMAVHRASDQVVQWATGEPGMAATRIAFNMVTSQGSKEIYLIDSDGENLHRLTDNQSLSMSPSWSRDGTKIVYSSVKSGDWRIYEKDLATGEEKEMPAPRDGIYITPTFAPDGQTVAFSVSGGTRSGLFTYNMDRSCCLTHLSGGPGYDDLSPTYSPDGRQIAFNTNRFGTNVPQIMVMSADGGDPETISPYQYGSGGYYSAPDWSPTNDLVAFHGAVRRGTYHILVADLKDRGKRIRQLTWEGNNEDPSWAPDGRHLVFVGVRRWGTGLMVVDVASGRLRTLLGSREVGVPAWSPGLGSGG